MPGTGQISHIHILWFSMIVNIILWGGWTVGQTEQEGSLLDQGKRNGCYYRLFLFIFFGRFKLSDLRK